MARIFRPIWKLVVPALAGSLFAVHAHAADLNGSVKDGPPPMPPQHGWQFNFVPYLWAFWLNADQTVQGNTVSLDAHLFEILSKSDGLNAMPWSSYQELRNNRLAFYSDIQYANIGFSGGAVRGPVSASASVDLELAVVEGGVSYQVARWPSGRSGSGSTAIDLFGGARYWYMNVDIDGLIGPIPIAQSGSVDWVDPLIGLSIRHDVAPGQNIFAKFDVGGFGVSSDFTWQALALYSFDFAQRHGITFSGKIGYRALGVDYSEGSGANRFAYDSVQHGPILGLGMKW